MRMLSFCVTWGVNGWLKQETSEPLGSSIWSWCSSYHRCKPLLWYVEWHAKCLGCSLLAFLSGFYLCPIHMWEPWGLDGLMNPSHLENSYTLNFQSLQCNSQWVCFSLYYLLYCDVSTRFFFHNSEIIESIEERKTLTSFCILWLPLQWIFGTLFLGSLLENEVLLFAFKSLTPLYHLSQPKFWGTWKKRKRNEYKIQRVVRSSAKLGLWRWYSCYTHELKVAVVTCIRPSQDQDS